MTNAEAILSKLPLYSYLIEPGPGRPRGPGYVGGGERRLLFTPLWTTREASEAFLRTQSPNQVSGLVIMSREELVAFLESIPPRVLEIALDPDRTSNTEFLLIGEILKQLKSGAPQRRRP